MKAVEHDYARERERLTDDALGRHISEMATVWHACGRARLGDGRQLQRRLAALRLRMAALDDAGEHALRWAAQNISQVMAALEGCGYRGRLPGVGRVARVRLLARELCLHSELKLGARRLLTALETFEAVEPMEAEELWALHAALRLELGAAFADVCEAVLAAERARAQAGEWAQRLDAGAGAQALGDYARPDCFYERLLQLLNRSGRPGELLEDVRRHAQAHGVNPDEAARRAQAGEAQRALLLKNAVETLRTLERIDWRELTCALGSVHIWLMRDPAGVYPRMDFESRQMYISAVSDVARRTGISQDAVARACVVSASESVGLRRHVGWYLTDGEGRAHIERALGAASQGMRPRAGLRSGAKYAYMAANVALSAGWLAALCALGMPAWLCVPGIAPALALAQAVTDRVSTLICRPRRLPRLSLDGGVPDELRTLVTIPALLTSPGRARELIEQLRSMAALERDDNVDFLLLGDFADSPRAEEAGDGDIACAAACAIVQANREAGRERFFYLQRRRAFNDRHDRYMGRERKRGALMALNALLLGLGNEFDMTISRAPSRDYSFVMTLDADTCVPPGAIRRLIGTLGHPLNRRCEDAGGAHGYSVLQPRMELSLGAVRNGFVRMMAGAGGFDAYQSCVSEAYWDVSGEAAYAGKGIYDLRAFDARLRGALPDNAILSHDLLEGMLTGAGYVSDTPLYDGFPATLGSYLKRLHRWTRGDWQLMRYLGREVSGGDGAPVRNPLRAFDRWKVFSNMFRSLASPVGLGIAIVGLYAGSVPALALGAMPLIAPALIGRWSWQNWQRAALRLALWPAEAACLADAIGRTIYRVYASGRNMLEWVTSADAEAQRGAGHSRESWVCAALCLPGLLQPVAFVPALMLAGAFAIAPLWTERLERGYESPRPARGEERYLSELARDTWRYFADNVPGSGLPPDNVQLEPPLGASMRTSPTNIGLYMASCVAARELDIIGDDELLTRLGRTARSLEKMDKWRGHIYNWVDIQTLKPLRPLYVSTVDSGNLLGCLYLCVEALERICADESAEKCHAHCAGAVNGINGARLAGMCGPNELCASDARVGSDGGASIGATQCAVESASHAPSQGGTHASATAEAGCAACEFASHTPRQGSTSTPADALLASAQSPEARAIAGANSTSDANLSRAQRAARLLKRIQALIDGMDFAVLYDDVRELFHIGVNTEKGELSRSYYDLLGSEARLASFAAMMKGDVPPRHFGRLGRACVRAGGKAALVSWSGTMFEYFMPQLLMDTPRGSLLHDALSGALGEQMARDPDMPWGVSESGYYGFDAQLNYQYRAFGMPALALSGGDAGVIAPYAAEMTAWFAPHEAVADLRRMQEMGFRGDMGFYEAVDMEPGRLPDGARLRVVKSYMAHHKGMALLGMANALTGCAIVKMFMNRPQARALSLLLEERPAKKASPMPAQPRMREAHRPGAWTRRASRNACPPDVLLLGGPDACALVTADGRGYYECAGSMMNRWRSELFGPWYGLRAWVRVEDELFELTQGRAAFEPGAARWTLRTPQGDMELEMCLSPEDGAFMARAAIDNAASHAVEAEITFCFEVSLRAQADDEAHPAFGDLFITGDSPAPGALLFKRRRREPGADEPMLMAALNTPGDAVLSCASGRRDMFGRNAESEVPEGLLRPLPGAEGRALEPCASLRARFTLPAHERRSAHLVVCAPGSSARAADMLEKNAASDAYERAAELSRLRARAQLEYLGIDQAGFFACMRAAAYMAFEDAPRAVQGEIMPDRRELWRLGISGDLPIMLASLDEGSERTARQAMRAHGALEALGMQCDLVMLCNGADGYRGGMLDGMRALAHAQGDGHVHVLDGRDVDEGMRELLRGMAAVSLSGARSFAAQMDEMTTAQPDGGAGVWPEPEREYAHASPEHQELALKNGWGDFDSQYGYVMELNERGDTPAPWVNILANESFGMVVSEEGGGFIWQGNSREGRLTRWRGDVLDVGCEQILYLRDERTGQFRSLTPAPCGELPMHVRHAPGESSFSGCALGIEYELKLCCDAELPVMYMCVNMHSADGCAHDVSLTGFVDWVMGNAPSRLTRAFVRQDMALCAGDMPGVGFAAFVDEGAEVCVNMLEFMGAHGDRTRPCALLRQKLRAENEPNAGSPCGALRLRVGLKESGNEQHAFAIGWAASPDEARMRLSELRAWGIGARMALAQQRWQTRLGALRFDTPCRALDCMVNAWLPYQTQVSRLWARTGYYQPGGAYGFRDQLQDVLSILDTDPDQAREHILRCAGHQFASGDVQHWWHEPYRGVRTRITDDMLFLPYVAAIYIRHTGDAAILDEYVAYLRDVEIPEGREDIYCECEPATERGTLREHCLRAIDRVTFGAHGLPLMGAGDWNDGMNRVGVQGRGESVWLGMFMCEVLREFAPLSGREEELMAGRTRIMSALERHGWDGRWYRRAYYDDGTPLGSAEGDECRIDILSQAWAALAGLDEARVASALDAAWELLVDEDNGIVRLLTPPFDEGAQQPGYIKGYLPGVRENGGQYTHAAAWFIMALAKTGRIERAWQVLDMLLPPNHSRDRESAARYAVEPYVLAADVYGAPPHEGRGGWTWYTGSAAWLTIAIRESLLGLHVRAGRLSFKPRVPPEWKRVKVAYTWGSARYEITASRDCLRAAPGDEVSEGWITLVDDGRVHEISVPLE